MSALKAAILSAAARLSGATQREAVMERSVATFLRANDVDASSLKFLSCEEPRRVYFGETKIDGVTMTCVVSADARLGALGGMIVSNMTGAQFQLLRFEWSHSLASCIRFYDFLLDRLNVHARLGVDAS